jgi:aspartyl-tRNA(Asn)/glutamyl-tRNA(Gln) amidotransferase subunit A
VRGQLCRTCRWPCPAYYVIAPAECSSNLSRFDGVRFGHRCAGIRKDLNDSTAARAAKGFGAEVKRRILIGTYALSHGYYDAYYLQGPAGSPLLRRRLSRSIRTGGCDHRVRPRRPSLIGRRARADPVTMYLGDIYTTAANLAGLPSLSMPCRPRRWPAGRRADHRRPFRRGAPARPRPPVPVRDRLAPARASGVGN